MDINFYKNRKVKAYLGLGSNQGDRAKNIETAYALIAKKLGAINLKSSLYESEAWGNTDQNSFVNSVIEISTTLSPLQLIEEVLKIETEMGRERKEKWGSRIIDIDILFYGDFEISYNHLKIPHPHLAERNFVLLPLSEINATLIHPNFKKNVKQLLADTTDDKKAWLFEQITHIK